MKPFPRHLVPWLVTVGLAASAVPAIATVVLAIDFDRMASEADRVVVGMVSSVAARWSADGERIETVVEVAVDRDLSGASGASTMRIVQPGGEIDGVGLVVHGMPSFVQGERVLLFLRAGGVDGFGEPFHSVFGMAQGKFAILPRLGGGWNAVQQFPGGMAIAAPDADGTVRTVQSPRPLALDLDEAIERIRRIRQAVEP